MQNFCFQPIGASDEGSRAQADIDAMRFVFDRILQCELRNNSQRLTPESDLEDDDELDELPEYDGLPLDINDFPA